jgi:hypothetical protein
VLRALALLLVLLPPLLPLSAAAQSHLAEGFSKLPPGSRIVLMPVDVELYEMSSGGTLEPRADWTDAAASHINKALLAAVLPIRTLPEEMDSRMRQFVELHRAVSSAVVIHHYGSLKLPTKQGLDWSIGPEGWWLAERAEADYALFLWVRDSYASAARKATIAVAAAVGLPVFGGSQQGYASLVELKSGRIVWFNRVSRMSGDLREVAAAQETLAALLADFPLGP